jgi:hypothetical protein
MPELKAEVLEDGPFGLIEETGQDSRPDGPIDHQNKEGHQSVSPYYPGPAFEDIGADAKRLENEQEYGNEQTDR